MITYDDFKKIELKTAKILKAERVEGSEKLIRLEVDCADPSTSSGQDKNEAGEFVIRQIVAGIGLK